MNILVTGSAGFIGYHLVDRLCKEGYNVIGVDNINSYYDVNLKYGRLEKTGIQKNNIYENKFSQSTIYNNYKFIQADLSQKESVDLIFKEKIDIVCHLAAQAGVRYSLTNPFAYLDSNWHAYLNILENIRHNPIKHFVYASSSSVYGINENMPFSTTHNVDHPISLYAASKKSNELTAHAYSHLYNIPSTGLRFFTVYGPWGRPDMALFIFVKNIFEHKPIKIFNNGLMQRDFTYVDDIIQGIVHVLLSPAKANQDWDGKMPDPSSSKSPYKIYNIGNSNPVKLLDFIEAIEQEIGIEAIKELHPMQPGDVTATYSDCTPLMEDFNYKPNTPVRDGIKSFIKWYKEFYNIKG